jgi:hypothetical protein
MFRETYRARSEKIAPRFYFAQEAECADDVHTIISNHTVLAALVAAIHFPEADGLS